MIGEILDAKYRIDKQLGAGGMGHVYLATHLGTTRVVAVKVIAPKWAAEPHFLARFQREAQACGRLRHPNIVNVTDFGIDNSPRGEMAYLVMELLDGQTLSDYQKSHAEIPLPLIADLLDQVGLALAVAHQHGIVHRDLKPDNIWLEPNGRGGYTVKVLDFGVAKVNLLGEWGTRSREGSSSGAVMTPAPQTATSADDSETAIIEPTPAPLAASDATPVEEMETAAMVRTPSHSSGSWDSGAGAQTMPGSLIGTPGFMSPEQALGKEIDYRSDIYSLAVVAYFLVCGKLPFTGKPKDLFEFHRTGTPVAPASLRKVPGDVSDAILAGLARDPAARPASAIEFTRRFHNAVDAEFLALRRSKAFLMQHLMSYVLLMIPIYGGLIGVAAIVEAVGEHLLLHALLRNVVVAMVSAVLFVFSDNALRASAALMALDEQARLRRFMSLRVLWKLVKSTPMLARTQLQALVFAGPGWVTGDCLWPVICVVENQRGRAALRRSRELMAGLRSAGRALAIRHLALAALAIADVLRSISFVSRGTGADPNTVITALFFPLFALFAAAPLFLYDRTAGNEGGPLLQLDRTPEVRINARALSFSSTLWLSLLAIYLLFQPIKGLLGWR